MILVQRVFHSYSTPEGALAQKRMACGQTHAAITVAELNIKQKRFFK